MKSVVKFKDGKDGWEIRDIPREDPAPGEVEIQIKAAGICGSELHLYHDNHFYTPPVVVGHEFAGVVSRIGEGVKAWKPGDRVVCENHKTSCGVCEYCKIGQPIFCKARKAVGYAVNGGWTSYICMPERLLLRIPDPVSYEEAAMTEPCSILAHALCHKAPIKAGETVLVQGCGTIGLIGAMTAKAAGAGMVILTGTDEDEGIRFDVAQKLGVIDHIINVSRKDLLTEVQAITGGRGVDMVVEASGALQAIDAALKLVRKNGRIVAVGEAPSDEILFKWNAAIFRACTVTFTYGSEFEAWRRSLQFMEEGKLNLKPLITHKLPLHEFHKGFELLESKKGIKVMLIPE